MKTVNNSKKRAAKHRVGRAATKGLKARKSESLEDNVVKLARTGKLAKAGQAAIKTQLARGFPVVYQKGSKVIKEFPNGDIEELATIKPAVYKVPRNVKVFKDA